MIRRHAVAAEADFPLSCEDVILLHVHLRRHRRVGGGDVLEIAVRHEVGDRIHALVRLALVEDAHPHVRNILLVPDEGHDLAVRLAGYLLERSAADEIMVELDHLSPADLVGVHAHVGIGLVAVAPVDAAPALVFTADQLRAMLAEAERREKGIA